MNYLDRKGKYILYQPCKLHKDGGMGSGDIGKKPTQSCIQMQHILIMMRLSEPFRSF